MKVEIIAWNAVAAWRWDMPDDDDVCGICRMEYDATCPNCKFPGDECPLITGQCHHTFHDHCLRGWIAEESARSTCPMCRQVFIPEPLAEEAESTGEEDDEQLQMDTNAG